MQERMRDLDRMSGRMHYTEPTTATRDSREGKSGMMRRSYIEAKEMHKDKDTTMQELEKYLKGVSEDITDVIGSMTPEERSMLKSKNVYTCNKTVTITHDVYKREGVHNRSLAF